MRIKIRRPILHHLRSEERRHGEGSAGNVHAIARDHAPLLRGTPLYLAVAVVGLVHGLNWPVMAHGVTLMPPQWLTVMRLAAGAMVVAVAVAAMGRLKIPHRADLPIVVTVGMLQLALVYGLTFAALTHAPAGRAAVLLHTSALWAVPISALLLREKCSGATLLGIVVGLSGVALLLAPWEEGFMDSTRPLGYALLLAGAVANAVASVHIRSHQWTSTPLELLPWQLGLGAVAAAIYAAFSAGPPDVSLDAQTVLVVAYQGVFASAIGVWGVLAVTRSLGAVSSNLALMLVPVIGLVSSALLLSEGLPMYVIVGLAMILVGAAVGIAASRTNPPVPNPLG